MFICVSANNRNSNNLGAGYGAGGIAIARHEKKAAAFAAMPEVITVMRRQRAA